MQCCITNLVKISFRFTDKAPFFDDLSVSKTHFTDKQGIFNDLSVNFWPLWWEFTDKVGFLDRLSVKMGSKRLRSYGQTAIFDHFVRKRHFLSRPFTDKAPIFIDMSVNGGAFAKWSTCSISASRRDYGQRLIFGRFHAWKPFIKNSVPAYPNSRTLCD